MTEIKTNANNLGQIQIADEVISVIAGTATMEVEGVAATGGSLTNDLVGILSKKNLSKGVKVDVVDTEVSIEIHLVVKFGYKIQEVAKDVQKKVKNAIETMTGLNVGEVNVIIASVNFEKDKNKEVENN